MNKSEPFTFKFDAISNDGKIIDVGDTVYQMRCQAKQLPEVISLKILEKIPQTRKLRVVTLSEKPIVYEVYPKDITTDYKTLCESWIADLTAVADFVPKQIAALQQIIQDGLAKPTDVVVDNKEIEI
jgi:hypothetical protein